jgi:outer membrane protein TolC
VGSFRFVSSQLWVAVAVALSCGAAIAQDTAVLALDEALRIAEERSEQLRAEDAAALAARELAAAAAETPDPVLTAGINNLPVNGPDEFSLTSDSMTMRSIGLSRELTRQDKRDARAARFEREAEAADAGRTLALVELQRATAIAWLERYYGARTYEVLTLQRQQAALQVEAAELSYRSGRGQQSDVFAARASVAAIDDRLAEQVGDNEVVTTKLARWIGGAAVRPLGALPAMTAVPLSNADVEGQLVHHPEIALLLKREEIARAEADVARTETRSDWTVELTYSQRGSDFSDMMSLNVSKPLQWRESRRQGRELAAQLASAARMRAQREEETRSHVADARALLQAWQANRRRLDRYSDTLIPLSAERTAAATTAYGGGTGSLGAVLDAHAGETDARIAELDLELETATLWAELNYLVPADQRAAAGQ